MAEGTNDFVVGNEEHLGDGTQGKDGGGRELERKHVDPGNVGAELGDGAADGGDGVGIGDLDEALGSAGFGTVGDVIGFAVASGSDAADEKADFVSGGEETFAEAEGVGFGAAAAAIPIEH